MSAFHILSEWTCSYQNDEVAQQIVNTFDIYKCILKIELKKTLFHVSLALLICST